jgi:PAS domain S-box-containing protein
LPFARTERLRVPLRVVAVTEPVLVVERDPASREALLATLEGASLPATALPDVEAAVTWLDGATPSLIVLGAPSSAHSGDSSDMVGRLRRLVTAPIVCLVGPSPDDGERAFAAGADDIVHRPVGTAEFIARVRGQLQAREYAERLGRRERDLKTVTDVVQALASRLDMRDILFTLVSRVAAIAKVDRCSVVLLGDRPKVGYVVATSDDEAMRDLAIDLGKYPEIQHVVQTGEVLVIRDAARDRLLDAVRQREGMVSYASLALLPLAHEGRTLGVLFLRAKRQVAFSSEEMTLLGAVANATATALRNARILLELRKETQQNVEARAEAEHRMQLFQRYRDFFESAADGLVVMDQAGKILFANPRAREITGFSEMDLAQVRLNEVLPIEEQKRALRLVRGFRESIYPQGVDVRVRRKHGEEIVLSVNFSSVLREEGAVLFTFRDVTAERKTEIELKQTKEFFERVIESSVDAIVSASLDGRVLLFNRAAARIFGYEPSEVIGKMSVEKLYPTGVAREVMRKIRDPKVWGPGTLEDYRVDMLNSAGETIAVKLSAALIVENDQAVGSVGIFTDIRERLRMEARLERAQDELREREKHAAVAELAGGAAHELNQPLTSIIGYAELLGRRLEKQSPLYNAAEIIITQAERMAEIVRKIGKITKYETKSYVGGAKILDLDKAASDATGKGVHR